MIRVRRLACLGGCAALFAVHAAALADDIGAAGWREDFHSEPRGWEVRGKPGTKRATFQVERPDDAKDGVLLATADAASGIFGTHLRNVDLHRTPILRWRWRVLRLPPGADGRVPRLDDQAIAIYVGYGGPLRQKTVAYRWETDTPVGTEGEASYAGGIVKTKWIAVRNARDGTGEFFVEERNVARDFQRAFGFVPDDITISVVSNSQYTGSSTAAELDWIALAPAPSQQVDAATPSHDHAAARR